MSAAPLSDKQRAHLAEVRNFYDAKLAEREVLHQSTMRRISDPEAAALVEQEYRRDREWLASERDARLERIRRGGA